MTDRPDWLDDVLTESAAPLPDDGFTDRVLAALPPPGPRRDPRAPILLASALAGGLVALFAAPGGRFLADAVTAVAAYGLHPVSLAAPVGALAVLAAVLACTVLLSAEG